MSERINTYQKNKLIMKYLGGKLVDHPELNGVKMWVGYKPLEGRLDLPSVLQFHTCWNELHLIIQKIISDNSFKCIDECTPEEWFQITKITQMFIGVDIDVAYYYVTEYIEWYFKNLK